MKNIHNIWGINFLLSNLDDYISNIDQILRNKEKIVLTGINPYSLSVVKKNPEMLDALKITTMANIDGILLKYSLQLLGYTVPERIDTPSLFMKLMELCVIKKYRVFLLGSKASELPQIEKGIIKAFPNLTLAGSHHGYFDKKDEEGIVKKINKSKADVLILGMPSPKKEIFVYHHHDKIDFKISLGVGGMFDILAGQKKLAPAIIRKMNIEWLYRFVQEPRRLLVRYKDMILYFTWFVLENRMFGKGVRKSTPG